MSIKDLFSLGALNYRGVNNNPFQQIGEANVHSFQSLSDYFKEGKSYSFQWLFLHSATSGVFDNILQDMPVNLIMRNMINLARPVYTDFTETSGNKEFLKISADFYRELF